MILTIDQLIQELQKFDSSRIVNIVDAVHIINTDGTEITEFGVSAVEAVLELENGCVGLVTAAGLTEGKKMT